MSWRELLRTTSDVILRVPPLFIMDSLLSGSFFILEIFSVSLPLLTISLVSTFGAALLLFCLTTNQLLEVYNYLVSSFILCVSAWWNLHYILENSTHDAHTRPRSWMDWDTMTVVTSNPKSNIPDQNVSLGVNFIVQVSLALLFILFRTQGPLFNMMQRSRIGVSMLQGSVYLSLTLPILCGADIGLSWQLPLLSVGIPTVYMFVEFYLYSPNIFRSLADGYTAASQTISTFGIQIFIETQWTRLHIPIVLLTFWLTRVSYHLVWYGWFEMYESLLNTGEVNYFSLELWTAISKHVLVRGCETIIAVLGLTSVVSYVAHYIGIFMAFCINSNNEEDKNMGTVSAILFFILALQTGLTGLEPEKRLVRLYRNFCLLFTALLHFVHSMVNPLLMSLSASRNLSFSRHARVLVMCLILITFPAILLIYLWSENSVSTWLLAVTAFSVEVIIKVAFSLMVYILFMIDAYCDCFWEKLDDYVYYVKSAGSTIEFLFGIFLFFNGGWIMLFESGGTIRAVMMCIHAYFNIWLQAKKGWQVFMKRRTAVQKINSLPLASPEQLEDINDICAICHSELTNARITHCHHYFHGVCLRKWLYVQDCCPLCHKLIYAPEQQIPVSPGTSDGDRGSPESDGQNVNTESQNVSTESVSNNIAENASEPLDPDFLSEVEQWPNIDFNDDGNIVLNTDRLDTGHVRNVFHTAMAAPEGRYQAGYASSNVHNSTNTTTTYGEQGRPMTEHHSETQRSPTCSETSEQSEFNLCEGELYYFDSDEGANPSPTENDWLDES